MYVCECAMLDSVNGEIEYTNNSCCRVKLAHFSATQAMHHSQTSTRAIRNTHY